MKIIFFIILLVPFTVSGSEFDPEYDIDRINLMNDRQQIHKELLLLKEANLKYIQELLHEESYKPNLYHYSITLELLLEKIPAQLDNMPDCRSLYHSMLDDYKVEWDELELPSHHIWTSFEKLCS